ncbi:uncharacterized protein IWZ02DRAFT_222253 [Phyllosticta citriasiana]|uniref:Uncharacterized protein n=1 Tax=Phyllosticta citriasiana TaxID=595635 RepID=A0ABR1KQA5_9PEZI
MSSGYHEVDDSASARRPLLSDSGSDANASTSAHRVSAASPIARVARSSSINSAKSGATQSSRRSRFVEILADDDDPLPASPSGLTRSDRKEARITNMDQEHSNDPVPAGSTTTNLHSLMTNTSRRQEQSNRHQDANIYGEAPAGSSFGDVYRPPPGSDSSAEPTPTSATFPPTSVYTPLGTDFNMHPPEESAYPGSGAARDAKTEYYVGTSERKSPLSPRFREFTSDGEPLKTGGDPRKSAEAYFVKSETSGFLPPQACQARRHFFRTKWITVSIILLSIYSTAFSGIFLGIAIRKPDWPQIHDKGALTPSNSSLLTAVFAKTIELTFATAIVSFIGQVLSRRSLSVRTAGKGVSLAEMNMRNWVTQPGNMVVNWETVRYAGFSILGIISASGAVCAMLYTSASDALVQPQLRFNHEHPIDMFAEVYTNWANPSHLSEKCKSPIPLSEDPTYRNSSCMDISYAAQGYHDYQQYLSEWAIRAANSSVGDDKNSRVPAYSLWDSTVQVNGSWMDITATEWNGRIINNVSLAMPHISVLQAAQHKNNGILQPEDLGGLGAYTLTASTPNPAVHVLCANMNRTELAPLVYTAFPDAGVLNTSTWPAQVSFYGNDTWLNSTVVDDLFRIGEKHGQHAPVFPKYPEAYNTVTNQTFAYGRVSVYVLGRDGDADEERYSMCQLKATITPFCSTKFVAMHDGSSLSVNCDPENDPMAYIKEHADANSGWATESRDWPWIASEWGNSLSLGAGITDGRASIARIITQTILRQPELDKTLPSIAEVLAVLSSSTLLMATEDATVEMDWVFKSADVKDPVRQMFNATILNRLYASGPSAVANNGFFIVLAGTFLLNVLCLAYLLFHRGLVTDFSEPPNLFSIAINSPPAREMSGACGAGPAGSQWATDWCIGETGGHLFVLPREGLRNRSNGGLGRSTTLGRPEDFIDGGQNLHTHGHGILPLHLVGGGRNDAHERLDSASTVPSPTMPPPKKPSKLQSLFYSMTHGFGGGGSSRPRGPASPAAPSSPYMGGGAGAHGANSSAAELTEMAHHNPYRPSPPPSPSPVGITFEPPPLTRTGSAQSVAFAQQDTGYASQSPRLVSAQTFNGSSSGETSKSPSLYSTTSGTMGPGPGSSSGGLTPEAGGNLKISRAYSKLSKRKTFL